MKQLLFLLLFISSFSGRVRSQTFTSNDSPVGLEHNVLFNANKGRFQITQTGQAQVNLDALFDGRFDPSYSNAEVSSSSPTIITISGLPPYHVQRGAWVGWSTRWWGAKKFKIEGYCDWSVSGRTGWVIIADVDNYSHVNSSYYTNLPEGAYSQLRFTFLEGTTDPYAGNRIGISEIVYIHPEAVTPFQGLFQTFNSLTEVNSNILIGKTTQTPSETKFKLDVAGPIRANEIVVNTSGADFVFDSIYHLCPLPVLDTFVKKNKHLPGIPPAKEMQTEGMRVSEMQTILLQKQEETILYLIEQAKQIEALRKENDQLKEEKDELKKMILEIKVELGKRIVKIN